MRKQTIGVIGGRVCNKEVEQLAHKIGEIIANVGAILVCGGFGGVMEAACKGAKSAKGETLGILSTYNKENANKYCDIVIPTGLGLARNVLVVQSADIIIALPGKYGTLSEIAFALQFSKPVISFNSWDIKGVIKVENIQDVERKLKELLKK
jgi:uncharacterized protein (TIGR00725 family)